MMSLRSVVVAAVAAAAAGAARGEVVFSTLGPNGSFSQLLTYAEGTGVVLGTEMGVAFTPSAAGHLTQMRAPLFGSSNLMVRLRVYRETGTLPGELVGEATFQAPSPPGTPLIEYPLPNIPVETGASYVLSVKTVSGGLGWRWHASSPGVPGRIVEQLPNQPWTQHSAMGLPAFELSIPAPGWAGVLAVAPVAVRRRRRGVASC